ncbi:alpha-1,2-fucosyltransferase [Algoriphagus aquimarinus]|uniref:Glycosyl transferase family 11 n=1 Tax=Algoriphagus aquimarinus TaxID=237018 RepID=A0A1I1CBL6_9BACT|nr:alpha-1,2-fucosyltransferase [Algoriphagus aquimarinus]SFB60059.1 Glycosyl transferase family 11 [Algoriphagus aquimarinus]
MIFFDLQGRLGNQIFQIVFLSLMKKEFGETSFLIERNSDDYNLDLFEVDFRRELNPVNTISTFLIKMRNMMVPYKKLNMESCLDEYMPSKEYINSNLSGYFQTGNYYLKQKVWVSLLLKINQKYKAEFDSKYGQVFRDNQILTIHVRRGDYATTIFSEINSSGLLPFSWFESVFRSIPTIKYDKIFIVSDCVDELLIDSFFLNIGASFEVNSVEVDFQLIMNSDIAIISNSSFAWWASFLNPKVDKKIYAPYNWVGYNAGIEYPKGIMIEDFVWVK